LSSSTPDPHGEERCKAPRLEPCGPRLGPRPSRRVATQRSKDEDQVCGCLNRSKGFQQTHPSRYSALDPHGGSSDAKQRASGMV
jgi:hypothetical protein